MAPKSIPNSLKRAYEDDIVAAQEKLLREPAISDLLVKCGDKTWKCQSAILMQRCDFFRAACGGSFKESESRVINLDRDKAESIDMLLTYLYTLQRPVVWAPRKGEFADAESAYIIGDKYQVSGLKTAGSDFMLASIKANFVMSRLLDANVMSGWCQFIRRLWQETFPDPDKIRELLLETILKVSDIFMKEKNFQNLVNENEEFRSDFIAALVKKVCGA